MFADLFDPERYHGEDVDYRLRGDIAGGEYAAAVAFLNIDSLVEREKKGRPKEIVKEWDAFVFTFLCTLSEPCGGSTGEFALVNPTAH